MTHFLQGTGCNEGASRHVKSPTNLQGGTRTMVQIGMLKVPAVRTGSGAGRLVVVSNRVPVPTAAGSPPPGGLAVALSGALETQGGLWFGWSGKIADDTDPEVHHQTVGNVDYAVVDLSRRDIDEYYHGFANRVLWPVLPLSARSGRSVPARRQRVFPGQRTIRPASRADPEAR